MGVYVDNMQASFRGMIMCHMSATTKQELLKMADKIGVARKWIQEEGTWREHFDICLSKRKLAVKFGAEEVTVKELVKRNMRKRHLKIGDIVRLKNGKKTAIVQQIYADIKGGVRLGKPLGGFYSWNEQDLETV